MLCNVNYILKKLLIAVMIFIMGALAYAENKGVKPAKQAKTEETTQTTENLAEPKYSLLMFSIGRIGRPPLFLVIITKIIKKP